jgi:hypothetical protein
MVMRTVIRRTIVVAGIMTSLLALTPAAASASTTDPSGNICVWVPVYNDWVCIRHDAGG